MMQPDPGDPAAPGDGSVRLIRTLTLTVFIQWLGATAIVPMLPVYIRHLGGSDFLAGLVMASFFAAGVLFQYPAGRLADRIGRRPVLVSGLIVYGIASLAFLAPIVPWMAILLRGLQGLGAGAAAVASLAMISGAVAIERRGRAFASIYAGEIAGMAVGPLIGSIAGVHHMWAMFLGSGVAAFLACIPALRVTEPTPVTASGPVRGDAGSRAPLSRIAWHRPMTGAVIAAAALGLTTGVYDICWTLLLVARGASGWQIGVSWTMFAVPFAFLARPSGWLADHMDRRVLVLGGLGLAALFCTSYPFIHSVPALITLGAIEAFGFAAAMPSMQSLLTQGSTETEVGRVQGTFATVQTACTALAAAGAGAAFAAATWLPFVTVAAITVCALAAAGLVWRPVTGRVHPHAATPAADDATPSRPVVVVQPAGVAGGVLESS
jgi:MFS family permease